MALLGLKVILMLTVGAGRQGLSGGSMVKNPPANAGDSGDKSSIPGSGGHPRVGDGNPLQCLCLEYSEDRGV